MRRLFTTVPIAALAVLSWWVVPAGAEDEETAEAPAPTVIPLQAMLGQGGEIRQASFEGLDVRVEHGPDDTLKVAIHNEGSEACARSLHADVSRFSSIPIGRMGPMAVSIHQEELLVRLAPGERTELTLTTRRAEPEAPDATMALVRENLDGMYVLTLSNPAAETPSSVALRIAPPSSDLPSSDQAATPDA